jgi:hypothetical protein
MFVPHCVENVKQQQPQKKIVFLLHAFTVLHFTMISVDALAGKYLKSTYILFDLTWL